MMTKKKRMQEIERCDRPREKIERNGPSSLTDTELIASIIGTGTKEQDVFSISGKISTLLRRDELPSYAELLGIDGIGPSKASVLVACFELARRYGRLPDIPPVRITSPQEISSLPEVQALKWEKQEHFLSITLNGASEVIKIRIITKGLLNHSLVHPREVYADAITDRAASLVCVHNHPSGNLQPSEADIQITRQLAQAGTILGIELLDHLIITKTSFLSIKDLGLL
jgi:DNA repair protein RadC